MRNKKTALSDELFAISASYFGDISVLKTFIREIFHSVMRVCDVKDTALISHINLIVVFLFHRFKVTTRVYAS